MKKKMQTRSPSRRHSEVALFYIYKQNQLANDRKNSVYLHLLFTVPLAEPTPIMFHRVVACLNE